MTSATQTSSPKASEATRLVPVTTAEQAHRGYSAGGEAAYGGCRGWRPAAPFLAQVIGERTSDNKLSRARRNLPTILSAYSEAAQLKPQARQTLDCSA